MNTVRLRLYRAGWTGDKLPWDDAQLWASSYSVLVPEVENVITLRPEYGSAASYYQIILAPQDEIEPGWISYRAILVIDNQKMGDLPISWYNGAATDWQSGIARYPETAGPRLPTFQDGPRGVWVLTAGRG